MHAGAVDYGREGGDDRPGPSPSEKLPMLYQGLVTAIVRIKNGRQQVTDVEAFRSRTKALLNDVERMAVATGYDARDVRNTHFPIVAFLDSVVLNSSGPLRADWEKKTLQEELFGRTDAGVVFFDKLEHFRSRRDSEQLADILEVFLTCILLGFAGRYATGSRSELDSIAERLKLRIETIRGPLRPIAPFVLPPEPPPPPPVPVRSSPHAWLLAAVAGVIFTALLFLILKWSLVVGSDQIRRNLF
jgi:type VI secretion system protein ImpK